MKTFEDIITGEFVRENFDKIKPEYLSIDEDGNVDFNTLREIFNSLHGWEFPYKFVYAIIHGYQELMDSWNIPSQFKGEEERIYKLCLDRGTTWKELLGYKKLKDVELL